MRLTPHQKKQFKTVLILLIGIPLTSFAVYKGVQYVSMAGASPTPRDVIISNLSMNSSVISWVTEKEVEAYVIPILDSVEQDPVSDTRGPGKRFTHYVELKGLEPSTSYSFILLSDGERYTRGSDGQYTFSTTPVLEGTPSPKMASGNVIGDGAEDSLIYLILKDKSAYPVSVPTSSNGNWIIDLSYIKDIESYETVRISDEQEIVLIVRSGNSMGRILEGSYTSLFDSDGTLNRMHTLDLSEIQGFKDYFPGESIAGVSLGESPVLEEEPTIEEPENLEQEEILSEEEEIEVYDTRIKLDIPWTSIPVGEGGGGALEYGEDTILVTNKTDKRITVVWRSNEPEVGYVKYGIDKQDLSTELRDTRDNLTTMNPYTSHFVESDTLEPETTYYFEVYSGDKIYDNSGEKFSVTTFPLIASTPPLDIKDGRILNGQNLSDWIIILSIIDSDELGSTGTSTYISTLPDENGEWYITVGDMRNSDGTEYFSYSSSDILQAFVLGAQTQKFDFGLGQNELEIDLSEIGNISVVGKVELLLDYGILNMK